MLARIHKMLALKLPQVYVLFSLAPFSSDLAILNFPLRIFEIQVDV